MKQNLQRLNQRERELLEDAILRLCKNSHDFQIVLNFFELVLANKKTDLITASDAQIKYLQGEAALLLDWFELINDIKNRH